MQAYTGDIQLAPLEVKEAFIDELKGQLARHERLLHDHGFAIAAGLEEDQALVNEWVVNEYDILRRTLRGESFTVKTSGQKFGPYLFFWHS